MCLITGSVEAIMSVMDFIMEKIREKPDLTPKTTVDFDSGKATAERDKQVRGTSERRNSITINLKK